jgi:uncharacterized membrane protein
MTHVVEEAPVRQGEPASQLMGRLDAPSPRRPHLGAGDAEGGRSNDARHRSGSIGSRLYAPRVVSIVGGAGFVALGVWGMVSPQSFFEAVAKFEPYNQHFLQDIGAFQIGLGVILLLAGLSGRADGLTIALIGVGVAAAFHTVSHVVGRDLGGFPEREIPAFAVMAAILLVAGGLRWRQVRAAAR